MPDFVRDLFSGVSNLINDPLKAVTDYVTRHDTRAAAAEQAWRDKQIGTYSGFNAPGSVSPDTNNYMYSGFGAGSLKGIGNNAGGLKDLGATTKPKKPGTYYYGPNYGALSAAAKANAERQTPLLQQNYQSSIGDILANKDFQQQQADDARNLAKQDWLVSNANTKRLNDANWFVGEQKFNNLRSLMNNSMNNQYGSIRDNANRLMAKTRDIRDQQMYATLNSNLLGNQTEYAGKVNSINQGLDQDRMNTYQQLSDLLRQAGSNLSDYAGALLSQFASYNDFSIQGKDGQINNWDWLTKNTGLKNDGNGNYALDYGWLLGDQMGEDEFNALLDELKSSHTPLVGIDQLALTRSAEDTRNYVRGQAGRNRNEAQKASYQAANQSYSTQQQKRGY